MEVHTISNADACVARQVCSKHATPKDLAAAKQKKGAQKEMEHSSIPACQAPKYKKISNRKRLRGMIETLKYPRSRDPI
jgi:hypothetical protein